MISSLLEYVGPRVEGADAVLKTDDTLSLTLADTRGEELIRQVDAWCHLRVRHQGRIGQAGSVAPGDWQALLGSALDSAARATEGDLFFPAAASLPVVSVRHPGSRAAGPTDLIRLGRLLMERVRRDGRDDLEVWVERSAGNVEIANSRGVLVTYEATLTGLGVRLPVSAGAGRVILDLRRVGVEWPGISEVEALAGEVDRRLDPPLLSELELRDSGYRVCFAPAATGRLIRLLAAGLVADARADSAPSLPERLGERVLPAGYTLVDDPLLSGRPGSRPADDEGVVSRTLPLIDRGLLSGWIADLGTGSRLGIPSTGHGRRWPFAPARPVFSNLVLAPGEAGEPDLLTSVGHGILLHDLSPLRRGRDGRIVGHAAWVYRVSGGDVVGRLPPVLLRSSLMPMLERVVAMGREREWHGAWCGPALVLDGVELRPA